MCFSLSSFQTRDLFSNRLKAVIHLGKRGNECMKTVWEGRQNKASDLQNSILCKVNNRIESQALLRKD